MGWQSKGDRRRVQGTKRAVACRRCGWIVRQKTVAHERAVLCHCRDHPNYICDGALESFDSTGEARCWLKLCAAEDRGLIRELRRQVPYRIEINGYKVGRYKADFVFLQDTNRHDSTGRPAFATVERVVDFKGYETEAARLRRKVIQAIYGIRIEIWSERNMPI